MIEATFHFPPGFLDLIERDGDEDFEPEAAEARREANGKNPKADEASATVTGGSHSLENNQELTPEKLDPLGPCA